MVDNTPIRVFNNHESIGVPFPKSQPMRIYSSLWNADDWATQGGRVKTDWSKAPFRAYYRNFKADTSSTAFSQGMWQTKQNTMELDAGSRRRLRWVQRYYMIYNYCSDLKRFPQGLPAECNRPWLICDCDDQCWDSFLYEVSTLVCICAFGNKWNSLYSLFIGIWLS